MNNDDVREEGGSSDAMPDDLKRLLARANADEEGAAAAYDPDAEVEGEEDVDDDELEESFGVNDRGEDAGTDVNGGSLQIVGHAGIAGIAHTLVIVDIVCHVTSSWFAWSISSLPRRRLFQVPQIRSKEEGSVLGYATDD